VGQWRVSFQKPAVFENKEKGKREKEKAKDVSVKT
jgi:hypothetical protein